MHRLMELYPDRLYLELAFHGNPAEKLVNRGLVAIAQRMDLPMVATNARAFRPSRGRTGAQTPGSHWSRRHCRGRARARRVGHGYDLPTITVEAARAQAYLKSPRQMWRAFGQMPAALRRKRRDRRALRLPSATREEQLVPDRANVASVRSCCLDLHRHGRSSEQQLADLVEEALPLALRRDGPRHADRTRFWSARATRCGPSAPAAWPTCCCSRTKSGSFCAEHRIPLAARGSATSSLVVWALGLSDVCPLDHGLDGRMFVHDGREDLPDLDLEVSSLHEAAVSAFVQHGASSTGTPRS